MCKMKNHNFLLHPDSMSLNAIHKFAEEKHIEGEQNSSDKCNSNEIM